MQVNVFAMVYRWSTASDMIRTEYAIEMSFHLVSFISWCFADIMYSLVVVSVSCRTWFQWH